MPEELKKQQGESGDVDTPEKEVDYISAIKELKENSVPRDKYNKLVEEHNQLLHSVIEGGEVENNDSKEPPKDISELRKELFENEDLTNLDYVQKTLDLRDQIISEGGVDPFLPVSHHNSITSSDVETAEKVAKTLRECVDQAEGNSEVFTALLNSRLIEPPLKKPLNKRR